MRPDKFSNWLTRTMSAWVQPAIVANEVTPMPCNFTLVASSMARMRRKSSPPGPSFAAGAAGGGAAGTGGVGGVAGFAAGGCAEAGG
jgi:hypothetical protein